MDSSVDFLEDWFVVSVLVAVVVSLVVWDEISEVLDSVVELAVFDSLIGHQVV